nr:immunoglobulin heavy chain junction region [Macaca mulatta]MOV57582.1 immunoglobulin heavy chain junction region [Macaca mulatta]
CARLRAAAGTWSYALDSW